MDIETLKKRMLMLAGERLRNRPFDAGALADELNEPFPTSGMHVRLELMCSFPTTVAQGIGRSDAWDRQLLELIDSWANSRRAPDIRPLEPHQRESRSTAQMKLSAQSMRAAQPNGPRALTPHQEDEVRRLLAAGESVSSIAPRFGVSRTTIAKYRKERTAVTVNNPFAMAARLNHKK